jgi:hypothetical protein
MSDTDAVFRPNPNQSSRSSMHTTTTTSQSSGRIVLDAEVHGMQESYYHSLCLQAPQSFLVCVEEIGEGILGQGYI